MPAYRNDSGDILCGMINTSQITKQAAVLVAEMSCEKHFIFLLCWGYLVSLEDPFQSCTRYTSFGYGYRDYFEFRGGNFSPNQIFYMEFYVKTSSDAHILLKADVSEDFGYEIVIGGGSNTFSQIRLLDPKEKKTMITQKTENFLYAEEYRKFWISIDKLGIVSVGKEEDDVFINWRFDNPIGVKWFSFGSWTNMKADWRFGCEKRRDSETIHEEKPMTPLQKLKRDLFTLYDPNALPVEKNTTLEVRIYFQIKNVQLDEKRGELTMFGSGDLKWQDPKMKWQPENYEGINAIYVPPFQIWTPSIRVLNALAVDRAPLFDMTAAGVMAKYDGSISWRAPFKSISFCTLDLEYWPFDIHNCSVLLGFWMEPPNLVLSIMDDSELLKKMKLPKDRTDSGWEVVQANQFNMNYPEEDDENYGILYVKLGRPYGPQAMVLTVPYIAALVMSLTSFWVPLNNSVKLHLSCGSLLIMVLTLFLAGNSVPAMTQSVPRILQLYSWSTVIACMPIIFFVALKSIGLSIRIPQKISKILSNSVLTEICCLPELTATQTEYCNLNEVDKVGRDHLNALKLVIIFERIFFLVYLAGLIFLLTLL